MKVIGQKHVGMNLHFVTTKRFLQERKKTQAILLVGKNALPPISSGAHVIKRSFKLQSQRPYHSPTLNDPQSNVKCLDTTLLQSPFRYDPILSGLTPTSPVQDRWKRFGQLLEGMSGMEQCRLNHARTSPP